MWQNIVVGWLVVNLMIVVLAAVHYVVDRRRQQREYRDRFRNRLQRLK